MKGPAALTALTAAITLTLAPPVPAASEVCELARSYPTMNRVDLAMTLVDEGHYRDYATARAVVDHDLTYICPGLGD